MNIKRIEREVIGIPTLDAKKFKSNFDETDVLLNDTNKYKSLNINGVIEKRNIMLEKKNGGIDKKNQTIERWITKIKVHYVL